MLIHVNLVDVVLGLKVLPLLRPKETEVAMGRNIRGTSVSSWIFWLFKKKGRRLIVFSSDILTQDQQRQEPEHQQGVSTNAASARDNSGRP